MEQLTRQTSAARTFFRVEKRTLKYKLFYFVFFFGSSAIQNYLPVYFRFVGMNALLTGILTGIRPFTRLVSAPLFSIVADKTGKYKTILMLSLVVSVFAYFSLSFVMIVHQVSHHGSPSLNPHSQNHSADMNSTGIWLPQEHNNYSTNNNLNYHNPMNKGVHNRTQHTFVLSEMTIFWTSLILVMLGDFFTAPVGAIMSATIIYWEGSSAFGNQRVFGALGFGIGSYLSGIAMERTAGFNFFHSGSPNSQHVDSKTPNYLTAFFIYLGVNILLILLVKFKFELVTEKTPTRVVLRHLKILFKESGVICFLVYVFIMGISGGVIMLFLFWFLEDLGASQALLGLTSFIMSLSEIPIFPSTSFLIRKLGHVGVLFLSLTCFVVRLICYTVLRNPWYVLLIEPLHGITLTIMWSACISFASVVAPPEIYTTMEGTIAGVHYGLGLGLGVVIGGVFYHHFGARNLFRGCVVLSCLCFPLLGVLYRKVNRDANGNITRYRTLDINQEQGSTAEEYQMISGNTYA